MSDRVLKLKRRSIPVWCYTVLWAGKVEDADFCKLFWATLLAPLGVYCWLTGRLLPRSVRTGYRVAVRTKALGGVGRAGDRVAAFFQRHEYVVPMATLLIVVGLAVVWALSDFESFWIAIAAVVVLVVLAMLADATPLGRFLKLGLRSVKSRTCPRVEIKP